jgi:diguanylate cyclase
MFGDLSVFRGVEGVSLARKTVDQLGAKEIPTSPANYEIWTAHLTGALPDLSREIEARLAQGERFTDEVNEALYDQFFANTRMSVGMLETSETIAKELAEVVCSLRDAGDHTGSYANELQTAAARFDGGLDPAVFRAIVGQLAATTREVAAHNRQLADQMQAASRQVDELKTALAGVKVEALTDGLTGLANRKMFDETLRRRLLESASENTGLCLLMFDIDHFKRVNDTWGHPIGDQVIRYIAAVLKLHAQGDTLAARYGGEEFALIAPRTTLETAQALANGISQTIKSKRLTRKSTGEIIGAITISVGIARYHASERPGDLISRADACLYAAKSAGRDCIISDAHLHRLNAAVA